MVKSAEATLAASALFTMLRAFHNGKERGEAELIYERRWTFLS
jgi:hypothetical protein